jgi:hypothetical protein
MPDHPPLVPARWANVPDGRKRRPVWHVQQCPFCLRQHFHDASSGLKVPSGARVAGTFHPPCGDGYTLVAL